MGRINFKDPVTGIVYAIDASDTARVRQAVADQWVPETPEAEATRTIAGRVAEDYDTAGDKFLGGLAAVARGGTVGLSDVGIRALGGRDAAHTLRQQRESIGGWATPLEIGGAVLPALATGGATAPESALGRALASTPAGLVARGGNAITRLGEGAGLAGRVGAGALGAGVEGTLQEAGAVASDLALDDDPVTLDRIAGSLSSRVLTTGATSALGGAAFGGLEHVLVSQRRRLAALKATEDAAAPDALIPDDVAAIPDRAGVKAAKEAEIDRLKAERAVQRAPFIDDVAKFREQTKVDQPWIAVATGGTKAEKVAARKLARSATAAADEAERVALAAEKQAAETAAQEATANAAAEAMGVKPKPSPGRLAATQAATDARAAATAAREAADDAAAKYELAASNMKVPRWMSERGKTYIEADKHIDRLLRNMEGLTEATTAGESARRSLRGALQEQRQALTEIQERADDLRLMHATDTTGRRAAALANVPKTIEANQALQARIDALGAPLESPRLSALEAHDLNLGTPKPPPTLMQKIKAAGAGAAVYGVANLALPGFAHFAAAPLAAAAGAKVLGEKMGPALLAAKKASQARQVKAIDALMTGARVARKATPVLASKVLAATRFAPEEPSRPGDPPRKTPLTLADHFDARSSEMARLVAPGPDGKPKILRRARDRIGDMLRAISMTAVHLADRMETRAVAKIEFLADKMPRVTQIGMTRIPPSEMQIRAWARYNAAADDPIGVIERVADGTVRPEDRETLQALYPDLMSDIIAQVVERMATLRGTLPRNKRLALSIFTGAPVDASMEPRILAQLQGVYATEPNTEGGTQAPKPQPAFGSVERPEGTPAQQRAG